MNNSNYYWFLIALLVALFGLVFYVLVNRQTISIVRPTGDGTRPNFDPSLWGQKLLNAMDGVNIDDKLETVLTQLLSFTDDEIILVYNYWEKSIKGTKTSYGWMPGVRDRWGSLGTSINEESCGVLLDCDTVNRVNDRFSKLNLK